MKKKIIVVIFAAVFCCSLASGLTACKKISHDHTYETEVVAPTCTEQGYTLHTCKGCGDSYKDTYVSALGHSYGEPSWAWSEDYTNATATFTCTNDSEHVNTLTATVTDEVTTPVTCTTDGEKDCTATVTFNNQTYTDVKTVTVEKTGHSISGNSCVNCGQPASEGLDMVFSEGEYTVSGIGTCTDTEILIPTTYNETLVVLSHKKPDSHLEVKIDFDNTSLDKMAISERAEKRKPQEKTTYKKIQEWIEENYGFKVHTAYVAEVKRELGLPIYDAPNAVDELKRPRQHPTEQMTTAIKAALKHFEII